MADVTVRIPGLLARFLDGDRSASVRADTLSACLDRLVDTYPELEPHLFDGEGRLRPHLQLFVGDRRVDYSDAPTVELDEGATVTILQAVSGG